MIDRTTCRSELEVGTELYAVVFTTIIYIRAIQMEVTYITQKII